MLKQAAAYHVVRERATAFTRADARSLLHTHESLVEFTSVESSPSASLAAAIAQAAEEGVAEVQLAAPRLYLLQATALCQLTAICNHAVDGTFSSVSVLVHSPSELAAYSQVITAAVESGLPKTDPRWVRALTFRLMAQSAQLVVTELEKGRHDLADVSPERLERCYQLACKPQAEVMVDVGLPTEARVAYPGVPPSDAVFLVLDRFGQAPPAGTPESALGKLDVETVLKAVKMPVRMVKMEAHGAGDLEATKAEARAMIATGELYGPKAVMLIGSMAEESLRGVTA